MFVGKDDEHEGDCYCKVKFSIQKIVVSRDLYWNDMLSGYGTSEVILEDN
jgi:hypothetical protein